MYEPLTPSHNFLVVHMYKIFSDTGYHSLQTDEEVVVNTITTNNNSNSMMKSGKGIYIRYLCLLALIIYKIYFILHGLSQLKNKQGEMAGIFICNNNNNVLTKCNGLDDYNTCGNGIECIASSCGRPLFPGIGISYAGTSDPYDENAATSTESIITSMAIFYSLVPLILQLYFGIHFLAWGNLVSLTRLGIMGFLSVMNDAVLKIIVKQNRPIGSSIYFHSYGMPSGHAATSIGLLTFILLELLMYHPNVKGKKQARVNSDATTTTRANVAPSYTDHTFTWGYGWQQRKSDNDLGASMLESSSVVDHQPHRASPHSLAGTNATFATEGTVQSNIVKSNPQGKYLQFKWMHHYYAAIWTIVLFPVPLSRPYLHDHTIQQVCVGSIVGGILGCIWYFCFIRGWLFRGDNDNRGLMKKLVNSKFGKSVGLNLGIDRWRFPDTGCDFMPQGCDGLEPVESFFSGHEGDDDQVRSNESYFMDN